MLYYFYHTWCDGNFILLFHQFVYELGYVCESIRLIWSHNYINYAIC